MLIIGRKVLNLFKFNFVAVKTCLDEKKANAEL